MAVVGGTIQNAPTAFDGMAHMGTSPWGANGVAIGARPEETETVSLTSTNSLLAGRLRFFLLGSGSWVVAVEVVGILRVPPTDMAIAGTVPVPVAAIIAGSACSRSHRMVSPSDLWPSSRVSWKIRAAHVAGIRILRPRPSTFVCRSFVDALFTGGAGLRTCTGIGMATGTTPIAGGAAGDLSSASGSAFNEIAATAATGCSCGCAAEGGSEDGALLSSFL